MEKYLNPENISSLAPVVTQSATTFLTSISNRIKQAKAKGNNEEVIKELDTILTELIEQDNNLMRQVFALQSELEMNFISEEEIKYITENLVPMLDRVIKKTSPEKTQEEIEDTLEIINSLISTQTLKILQLIGFNFKDAIGKPTTELVKDWILSSTRKREIELSLTERKLELQTLQAKQSLLFYEMINDSESFNRYKEFNEMNNS